MTPKPPRPLLTLSSGADDQVPLATAMIDSGRWYPYVISVRQFLNGNRLHTRTAVVPEEIDILWSAETATGERLLDLALAADCLWRGDSQLRARVLVPYLPYSRSNVTDGHHSLGAAALFRLLDAIPAISDYAIFELHAPELAGFSARPVRNVQTISDIAAWARDLDGIDMVVAPDRGRAAASLALADRLGVPVEVLLKRRDGHADRAVALRLDRPAVGGARVLIFDDELTTGATLTAAVETLTEAGAKSVHAVVARSFAPAPVVEGLLALPLLDTLATTVLTGAEHVRPFTAHGLPVLSLPAAIAGLDEPA